MDDFVEWLKEETLPGIWSKGVQLSRAANSIEFISSTALNKTEDELKFKIKTQERLLAFSVTLWIRDEDSYCNCGSKVEPCHHIVAVALAMQNKTIKLEKNEGGTRLEYQWKIDEKEEKIELSRWIVSGQGRSSLTQSLVSYLSGVQSGRILGKLPATSSLDLKIDENLQRPAALLDRLSELPPISGLTAQKSSGRPRLRIVNSETSTEGVLLVTEEEAKADFVFKNGMERIGDVLRVPPAKPPFAVPRQIEPSQYEKFLSEGLPALRNFFDVEIGASFLPKLVDRDPVIDYKIVKTAEDQFALTPVLSYGPLSEREIARKDRAQEQELLRELRQNKQLSVNQTVYLTARELFQRRSLSPAVNAFAESQLTGLLSELHVDYAQVDLEKQSETILHLLSLREKGTFTPQAKVLAKSLNTGSATSSTAAEKIPTLVPRALWTRLRDYQKQGVYWLSERNTAGAILADDMGLGKTVQTLAIVQKPTLIVVPTSLLHNWKDEVARFRPDLRVNVYHGSSRNWDADADITITSYGILRSDQNAFLNLFHKSWKLMVLDEAHLIRNQETLAAQTAFAVPASMKIALTGTPVQNKRGDLFSLFQFVSPGLFRHESEMKPELVAPFVLRRKKEEVLKELPPKTYLLHEIELKETERARYQSVWAAAKAEILQQISVPGKKANPLSMFEVLLRARQACDHSGLFFEADWKLVSSKLAYLLRMISELQEAGHSVLVYSQWTKFLDRIEEELESCFPYERLDGSTTNRAKVVGNFQSAAEAKVFLLSLHAGGVGLNLTRASHVIFCDPWWNPFVELQAEDRAYRMGQEKPVTIHRLICEATIEEKLQKIQEHKKQIGVSTLGITGEETPNLNFTEADLISLLQD